MLNNFTTTTQRHNPVVFDMFNCWNPWIASSWHRPNVLRVPLLPLCFKNPSIASCRYVVVVNNPSYHHRNDIQERDQNNFPIGLTIEYSTTGQAGGYLTDSAPESTHQPAQRLCGSYYASVPHMTGDQYIHKCVLSHNFNIYWTKTPQLHE